MKPVWVEIKSDGTPIRIFRNKRAALASKQTVVQTVRTLAVADIRHQLYDRSKGNCELCGTIVTENSGHMHERQHRGRGGEISLENSVFVCAKCHGRAHKERNPQWARNS